MPKTSFLKKDIDFRLKEATKNLTDVQLKTLKNLQESPSFLKMVDLMVKSNQNLTEMMITLLSEHKHTHHGKKTRPRPQGKPVGMGSALKSILSGEGMSIIIIVDNH